MSEEVFMQRSTNCGALRKEDNGKTVILNGWVFRDRNHGALSFINLRDRYGVTQVVVDDDATAELQETARQLKEEYCIAVKGIVRLRPEEMVNKDMPTGEIEVKAQQIQILSKCDPLPFRIDDPNQVPNEDLRLQYRFLDLRTQGMQDRIRLRHEFIHSIRNYLYNEGFYEIETPTLVRKTPEGARDFIVPSRLWPGKFYALPQSPQLYKQLLMVGGMDKYFQIARCYRDEDARGDRQLEFTQLDVEMSFVKRDDVLLLMEQLFGHVFKEVVHYELPEHFRRIKWYDSMNTYGCDKPDLRFGLEMHDMDDFAAKTSFGVFKDILAAKGHVKALCAPNPKRVDKKGVVGPKDKPLDEYTRKYIDSLEETAKTYGAKGLAWAKVGPDGTLSGGISKYLVGLEKELVEMFGAKEGDVILFIAHENWKKCCASLGAIRSRLGKELFLIPPHTYEFCWIIDFPLFEYNDEEGHWEAAHHMFSMPQAEYIPTLEKDPGAVLGDLYDMVCNGYECASGSIRIHDIDLQKRIFRICNYPDDKAQAAFGFLLDAFKFGPPPHGGIAPGIDRMVMIISEQNSIHEVIAFPKNTVGVCSMDDSPSPVDDAQLTMDNISVRMPPEKDKK